MRRAAKTDANHSSVVEDFRKRGFSVLDVSQLKKCCDIFVSKRNQTIAIEIKDGEKVPSKRKLTEGEQNFKDMWKGRYEIVEFPADVARVAFSVSHST